MNVLKLAFFIFSLVLAFIPLKGELFGYAHLSGKFFDFLHFPFFAILSVLVFGVQIHFDKNKKYRLAILIVFVVLVEVFQGLVGRSASLTDVLWGGLGICFGWAWSAPKPTGYYWMAGLVSCYTAILGFTLHILFLAESRLPIVSKMDSIFITSLFDNMNEIKTPELQTVWSDDHNSQVLKGSKVDFNWSGFSYKFPLYANLEEYKLLSMDYYSPIDLSELDIRFNSRDGRKIYKLNNISKGWNKLTLNINSVNNNDVDWAEITGFAVFYESKGGPDTYLVDNIIFQ